MTVLTLVGPLEVYLHPGQHPALAGYVHAVQESQRVDTAGARLQARLHYARVTSAPPDAIADLRDRALIHLLDVEEPTHQREEDAHAAAWETCPDTTCDISGELLAAVRRAAPRP